MEGEPSGTWDRGALNWPFELCDLGENSISATVVLVRSWDCVQKTYMWPPVGVGVVSVSHSQTEWSLCELGELSAQWMSHPWLGCYETLELIRFLFSLTQKVGF